VAQYTKPAQTVQRLCEPPAQLIALQREITDLKAQQFLPPTFNHSKTEGSIQSLEDNLAEAWRRPATEGFREELQTHLALMTRHG